MNVEEIPGEEWRPLAAGIPGRYLISSEGRVYDKWKRRLQQPRHHIDRRPSPPRVTLIVSIMAPHDDMTTASAHDVTIAVAHWVLTTFVSPRPGRQSPHFHNGDLSDARLSNLSWGPRRYGPRREDASVVEMRVECCEAALTGIEGEHSPDCAQAS